MFSKQQIKQFSKTPTPFYYYDLAVLKETITRLKAASSKYGYQVHYAMKANTNDEILAIAKNNGLGADCVSGNEVAKAVKVGFKNDHIVFAGVGKSDDEINIALKNDIFSFNSESLQEVEVINELAAKVGKKARISLRINPNVNAHTHHYITTGLEENKFGINMWEMENVLSVLKTLKNVELIGIHFHVGSQVTDLNVFKNLCTRVNEIQQWLLSHNITVEHVNVGGGLGVDYHHPDENLFCDFETYFGLFKQFLEVKPGQKVHFELGRSIVAQCGSLISKVLYVKNGKATNFAILDAGMTELIRPALYHAYHKIENLSALTSPRPAGHSSPSAEGPGVRYDVVGPICESTDCFGKAIDLPETKRGDLMVIRTAGAYGEVLSSNYNLREKVKAVYSE